MLSEIKDDYLTVKQFAKAVGVSENTVYTWLKDGHPVHGHLLSIRPVRDHLIALGEVRRLFSPVPRQA